MSHTHPSVGGVARGRYWTRALIRAVAVPLLAVATVRAWSWVVECAVGLGILSVFSLIEFWQALAPMPVAIAPVLGADRLARWIMPMPRPICPECGYALQPTVDRCPECGLRQDAASGG